MWLSNFYNTGLNRNNFFKQWLFCINKIFETKALSSGQCDALWRCSSLRTRLCRPSHMPGLLELWTATPQVFRLSASSKAGLPKALLNTEGSVGVDVNELYFKYQRLLNKESGCFSINLSVFIVNSWPCYSESVGRHSCISVLWERFPKSVSGHSQTHCSWNLKHLSVELHVFMQLQWCIKQTGEPSQIPLRKYITTLSQIRKPSTTLIAWDLMAFTSVPSPQPHSSWKSGLIVQLFLTLRDKAH